MLVHALAQVVDDAFADAGAEVALADVNGAADQRHSQHGQPQLGEAGEVLVGQNVVEEVAVKQRGDKVDERTDDDGSQHEQQRPEVGSGVAPYPA